MITETFTPPDETVAELGVAGHELVKVKRRRPPFTLTRPATSADRRHIRLDLAVTAAALIIIGTLTLLVESGRIGPTVYLRTGSIVSAVISVGLAVWLWVRMGAHAQSDTSDPESLPDGILGTATSGGSTVEAVGTGLFARLPPKVARMVAPGFILVWAALAVLVAFSLAPPAGHLWSSATAAADLIAFTLAGLRALLLASIALVKRDGSALIGALLTLGLMGVLLLVAELFGWLDDWTAIITWVRHL
jgi:protein-S-isoprenylcysteine O-methyltransferase Ste14